MHSFDLLVRSGWTRALALMALAPIAACSGLSVDSIPTRCLAPPVVENADSPVTDIPSPVADRFRTGTTASYTCLTGFVKTGSDSVCMQGGTWSPAPTCTPNATLCPEPTTIPNAYAPVVGGGVGDGETTSFGAIAHYDCVAYHVRRGENPSCQADGTWTATPTCERVDCPSPFATYQSMASGDFTGFGSMSSYACNPGFVPSGATVRTCGDDGHWSGVETRCVVTAFVGDFDSDGKRDDHATWNTATHVWNGRRTDGSSAFAPFAFGSDGDIPLVGDFDSDGFLDDVGTYTPSEGAFRFRRTDGTNPLSTITYPDGALHFGASRDVPIVGDWESDGDFDDIAVWTPANGNWLARRLSDNTSVIPKGYVSWGPADDTVMVCDGDSDGFVDDMLAVDPDGILRWFGYAKEDHIILGLNGFYLGNVGDQSLIGDLDADGFLDDLTTIHPTGGLGSSCMWVAKRIDNTSIPLAQNTFGHSEDAKFIADFDGDGFADDLGVYEYANDRWSAIRTDGTAIMTNVP